MKDKIKLFLREYKRFKRYARTRNIVDSVEEEVQLFAIYMKELRTDKILDNRKNITLASLSQPAPSVKNADLPATKKQIEYLRDLAEKYGLDLPEERLQAMTREEASRAISDITGRQ